LSATRDLYDVTDVLGVLDDLLTCQDTESLNARAADRQYRQTVIDASRLLSDQAFLQHDEDALRQAHAALGKLYEWYFSTPSAKQADCMLAAILDDIRGILENAMLDDIRARVDHGSLTGVPDDHQSFLPRYRHLISMHQASDHPFYRDFLENRATLEDVRFYLAQETVLDPRFDDILALLIMGADGPEKMELVGNLWDELGNGQPADVHTAVFSDTLGEIGVTPSFIANNIMLESMVCGNVSAALALSKRHYYKAIGYFGVTEYLTPRRFRSFVVGCKRLDLPKAAYRYHDMHIQIDARHGPAWFKNILVPAVAREPGCAYDIALGTLMRLETSTWYLDALQRVLDVDR
jgi:pyrroloquinoline quinone (PQQ) biosynthesis protein C